MCINIFCRRCGEPAATLTRNVCGACHGGPVGDRVIWRDSQGRTLMADASRDNVKRALLDSGTNRSIHRLRKAGSWFEPLDWGRGLAWLRELSENGNGTH